MVPFLGTLYFKNIWITSVRWSILDFTYVNHSHNDRSPKLLHKHTNQSCLKDVGWKERQEDNDERKHQTYILDNKNNQKYNAFKTKVFTKCIDQKIHDQQRNLYKEYWSVSTERQFHLNDLILTLSVSSFHLFKNTANRQALKSNIKSYS